jgi:EAL and modified HD-GYP domain-containing signal transduction protein
MHEHPVLGQVILGYGPLIDRRRALVATRLTVFPGHPDAVPDPQALLAAVCEAFPEPTGVPDPWGDAAAPGTCAARVMLSVAGEPLLQALLAAVPPPHVALEVPAFLTTAPDHAAAISALHAAGRRLMLRGRLPARAAAAGLGACFFRTLVEAGEPAEDPAVAPAAYPADTVVTGLRTMAAQGAALQRGAAAVAGWPLDDPPPAQRRAAVPPDLQVVMELIAGVDREWPAERLEAILRRDPTLAFRLLRYINSPAFGLAVEISSFAHALLVLGYRRLGRWLALLLASAGQESDLRPVMAAAVRRGLVMEELVRPSGDAELRGEMFICGVFSLLDRLLRQPLDQLLESVPVPERVAQALLGRGGPLAPALDLARALEGASLFDIREHAERLLLDPAEVNRAVLAALRAARELEAG